MAKKREKMRLPVLPVLITVLAGIGLALLLSNLQEDMAAAEEARLGVSYLESLESKDPQAVDDVRNAIFQAKLNAERDEIIRQLNEGEVDPFSMFQDFVLLGDSRVVGFEYFGFLDQSRVMAASGDTIRKIEESMDEIRALNPSYIYISYGMNDIISGLWDTADEYVAEYLEIIDTLRAEFPGATIVVSSILPARDPAFNKNSKFYNIPDWNAAMAEAFAEHGVIFADNDAISAEHADQWEPDGIHVRQTFYTPWAKNMIIATLMGGGTNEIES